MGPVDRADRQRINDTLADFHTSHYPLPGVQASGHREVYVTQLLESIRRVRYITVMRQRPIDPLRADPASDLFDPHKGAAYLASQGELDEAFWQVFISVHFGRHRVYGWRCARAVYGGLGTIRWDWARISSDPQAFRQWLTNNQATFSPGGPYRGFGNHRKYQSLDANDPKGTGEAFVTYVNWIRPPRSHRQFLQDAISAVGNDAKLLFAHLYDSMRAVASFGRTARFDFLSMVGKLQLAPITPDRPYLQDATGPLRGARLLFLGNPTAIRLSSSELDMRTSQLGGALLVGMQEMEDSLCNWQKSPGQFQPYRG
jgi:Alpha-glutamyl/putrescinyl thymine pyrophosphorylase clade 3